MNYLVLLSTMIIHLLFFLDFHCISLAYVANHQLSRVNLNICIVEQVRVTKREAKMIKTGACFEREKEIDKRQKLNFNSSVFAQVWIRDLVLIYAVEIKQALLCTYNNQNDRYFSGDRFIK